jgi:enamine deaminase RidA (YjgF/YER057c/UK114 family)
MHSHLLPENWTQPKGYANAVLCDAGQTLYVGGQIGWNQSCEFETDDFVAQVEQTLVNIKALLDEANAKPEQMTRMTWYVTSKTEYKRNLRPIGQVYQKVMGKNYPAMSVVQVLALIEDRAQVEIEVTAVIPQ